MTDRVTKAKMWAKGLLWVVLAGLAGFSELPILHGTDDDDGSQEVTDHPEHVGVFKTLRAAEVAAIRKRNELFTHNDADRNYLLLRGLGGKPR